MNSRLKNNTCFQDRRFRPLSHSYITAHDETGDMLVLETNDLNRMGSSPIAPKAFLAQMEEHYPSKLGVAGSNPAERRRNNSARIRVLACHAKSRGFKSHFLRKTTWWNGRHGRLKICSSNEDMGSSPIVGIKQ